jgi:hypothetical protein
MLLFGYLIEPSQPTGYFGMLLRLPSNPSIDNTSGVAENPVETHRARERITEIPQNVPDSAPRTFCHRTSSHLH